MSDTTGYEDFDPDDDPQGEQLVRLPRKDIRALEAKGKKHDEVLTENERLKRELAFTQAGIDLSTEQGKFFARGYEGELDPTAIAAAASTLGFQNPTPAGGDAGSDGGEGNPDPSASTTPDTPLVPGEEQITGQAQDLARGSAPDSGISPDPYKESVEIFEETMAEGGRWEEAAGLAFNSIVNKAMQGDKRVVLDRHSKAVLGDK